MGVRVCFSASSFAHAEGDNHLEYSHQVFDCLKAHFHREERATLILTGVVAEPPESPGRL